MSSRKSLQRTPFGTYSSIVNALEESVIEKDEEEEDDDGSSKKRAAIDGSKEGYAASEEVVLEELVDMGEGMNNGGGGANDVFLTESLIGIALGSTI
jgi:hypothetical protein